MKLRSTLPLILLISLLASMLVACDNSPAPAAPTPTATAVATTPEQQSEPTSETAPTTAVDSTATPATEATNQDATETAPATGAAPTGTIVDAATVAQPTPAGDTVPTATAVTATSTGDALTALQALDQLRDKVLEEMPDARLAMLVNSKPEQQKILLGTSLGDPNVNEPTPGGLGRNWTLVAVSPSQKRAMAFSTDGTVVDLTAEGTVPDELLANFGSAAAADLDLSKLDSSTLKDSDEVMQAAGSRGSTDGVGLAMLAPDALGIGPLPTPAAGGPPLKIAYELFSTDPATQLFVFFDAITGDVVLDSGT